MKGKEFESFIENLERQLNRNPSITIEKNAHLKTRNGSIRQIDVLLTHKIERHTFITVLECKDWKRKVDIKVIEEFASKLKAVEADRGILISKSGFTSGLIKEALAYPNISLYTIQEADNAISEILDFDKIGFFRITYNSNDWTVRFQSSNEINKKIELYTKLKTHETNEAFDITQIAGDYLSQNKNFIIKKILEADNSGNQKIRTELTLDINLSNPAFYEIDDNRTYITGFKCIVNAALEITILDIAAVYKYQNISKNETVALLIKLKLDEKTNKLILD